MLSLSFFSAAPSAPFAKSPLSRRGPSTPCRTDGRTDLLSGGGKKINGGSSGAVGQWKESDGGGGGGGGSGGGDRTCPQNVAVLARRLPSSDSERVVLSRPTTLQSLK